MMHYSLILPLITALAAINAATATSYDYIIVGGGTAGLTVANRLSEDPAVSVLVIEPGQIELNNPNVTDITRLAYTYDSPLDWAYQTTEQKFGNRRQVMRAGRALGGTSVMNGWLSARLFHPRETACVTNAAVLPFIQVPLTHARNALRSTPFRPSGTITGPGIIFSPTTSRAKKSNLRTAHRVPPVRRLSRSTTGRTGPCRSVLWTLRLRMIKGLISRRLSTAHLLPLG